MFIFNPFITTFKLINILVPFFNFLTYVLMGFSINYKNVEGFWDQKDYVKLS